MIKLIKYRYDLWQLETRSKVLMKIYTKVKKESTLKSQADFLEIESIAQEMDNLDTLIEYIKTKYYQDKCHKLIIPLPEKSDKKFYYVFNFNDDEGDRAIFTTDGFHHARSLIRQEEKERRESISFWTSTIVGIIGGLIGLITIIKSKF